MIDARRTLSTVLLLLAASASAQEDDCAAKRAALQSAQAQLRDCLSSGKSCDAQFEAKRVAETAIAGCPEPTPAPAATPAMSATEPTPAAGARIALVVEAANAAAVEAAAREALAGAEVLDASSVRAARAFLGGAQGSDESLAKLRQSLNVTRLIAIDVKADGATRFVGVRAIDESSTAREFAETTDAEVPTTVKRLVSGLPAPRGTAAVAVAPVAAPTPAAVATPAAARPTSSRDDEEDELRYAKKGTFTLSMESSLSSRQATFDPGIGDFSFDERIVQSNPTIGYFLADGVFVSVGVFTDLYGYSDDTDATELDRENGVSAGAGYFAKLGSVFVGPQLLSRYRLRGHREEDSTGEVFNYEQSTLETIASLGLRLPIGTKRGAVLNVNLYFRQLSALYTYDLDGDLRATDVGVNQGISIFF